MRFLAVAFLVLASLPALSAQAAEPEPGPYQKKLEEILSRDEFRAETRRLEKPKAPTLSNWAKDRIEEIRSWTQKIRDWLYPEDKKKEEDGASSGGDWKGLTALPRAAAWTLAGLGLVLLAVLAWRMLKTPAVAGPASSAGDTISMTMPDALSRAPEAWRAAAEAHALKGEWKLALRACYLALLNELHGRRVLRYARERTNGEYVSALASHPAREAFAGLTVAFDSAWYGTLAFGEAEYRAAERLAEAVDRATAPAEVAV